MRPCAASLVDGVDEQTSESRLRDQYRSPKRIVRSLDGLHLDPVVLRRSERRFQRWAIRAIAAFLAVYMLGTAGIPTLVPYLAVLLAVIVDGGRLIVQRRRDSDSESNQKHGRRETIH